MKPFHRRYLIVTLLSIGSYAHGFGDGLFRSLGTMELTDSSRPCTVQMYNIKAFKSELEKINPHRDCVVMRNHAQKLLHAMDQTNVTLCSAKEAAQLKRWRDELEFTQQHITQGDPASCDDTHPVKR